MTPFYMDTNRYLYIKNVGPNKFKKNFYVNKTHNEKSTCPQVKYVYKSTHFIIKTHDLHWLCIYFLVK